MKNIFFIVLLSSLFSCNSENEIVKVSSTGKINSVLVVVDNDKWEGEVGDIIKGVLGKSLVGLPQEEHRFSLTQIASHNFNKMLRPSRNIISISFSNKNSFAILKDKYAEPQRVIVIHAKNKESLAELLQKYENKIVAVFKESDLKTKQKLLLKKYWDVDQINTFKNQKIAIKIPFAYRKVQDTLDYIWFRKDIPEGYLNIQAYIVPFSGNFTKEGIIKIRDQKGAQFIPGEKEGTHLITEDKITPTQYNTTKLGLEAIETRGVWKMKGGFMGGPFLSYALLDTKNSRIIIAEGFVYAPNVAKRDYLFELEALLQTLEI